MLLMKMKAVVLTFVVVALRAKNEETVVVVVWNDALEFKVVDGKEPPSEEGVIVIITRQLLLLLLRHGALLVKRGRHLALRLPAVEFGVDLLHKLTSLFGVVITT